MHHEMRFDLEVVSQPIPGGLLGGLPGPDAIGVRYAESQVNG